MLNRLPGLSIGGWSAQEPESPDAQKVHDPTEQHSSEHRVLAGPKGKAFGVNDQHAVVFQLDPASVGEIVQRLVRRLS
jgi:hypothetical protein